MPEAITLRDLTFTWPPYRPGRVVHPLFEHLELHLEEGDALTLLGASGRGKSTLCHILDALLPRYGGGAMSATTAQVMGYDLQRESPPPDKVGLLFQETSTQLFTTSVEEEIAWGLEALGLPSERIESRLTAALRRFGLEPLRRRPPWALSGGQQKRLALASLWAQAPRLLLLDEPLSGLDPEGRAEVVEAMAQLREEGATLLATAALDAPMTTERCALLEAGRLSVPRPHRAWPTARLIQAGVHLEHTALEALQQVGQPTSRPAIEIRKLHYRYPNGPEALHDLSLTIAQGEMIALVGHNGAGKTTLARHLNGLLRPSEGEIHLFGRPTVGRSVGELAREVGFLFQRPERQIFAPTVREEIAFGPRQLGLEETERRVEQAMHRFGLTTLAEAPPAILSYGERRAVTLAALAALTTPILVLDEPTGGLDGHGWQRLLDWLTERRAAGATIILITHEEALAAVADRIVHLEAGRIVSIDNGRSLNNRGAGG